MRSWRSLFGQIAEDLKARLGNIVVAIRAEQNPCALACRRIGAMTVLLKDALKPNRCRRWRTSGVYTADHFATPSHGCNL